MSNFIVTRSGRRFYYEDITEDSIDIDDIAHALSNTCRYGGHIDRFYSVAQHSVIVSELVPAEYRMAALLHDASEAYISDIVSPAKRMLGDYQKLEAKITEAINKKFNIDTHNEIIKKADLNALYAEAMQFYGSVDGWNIDDYAFSHPITPFQPKDAKELFLHRYGIYGYDDFLRRS